MKRFSKKMNCLSFVGIIFFITFVGFAKSSPQDNRKPDPLTGKVGRELLIWENDEDFLKHCEDYKITTRMAAFQTTLPDPLPGEEYNVGLAAQMIAGMVVPPGKIFSLNGALGPRTVGKGFRSGPAYSGSNIIWVIGGGICKISTTLYNTAILADLKIVERWPHGMTVPYVPPGQDATISYGARDFKFQNTTGHVILIWAEKVKNTLYMAFYSNGDAPEVTWHHQTLKRWPTYVIQKYNAQLRPGERKVVHSGADGIWVKNWVTVKYKSGEIVSKKLGIDYYAPLPEIVEIGRRY